MALVLEQGHRHATTTIEEQIIPTLAELGIGLVPFSPFGNGLLTGTITADTTFGDGDARAKPAAFPRFAEESRRANEALVDLIRRSADEHGATPEAHRPGKVSISGRRQAPRRSRLERGSSPAPSRPHR
jgi:aryl-alcohol dehydrogenase-like predicted oxidoreductase